MTRQNSGEIYVRPDDSMIEDFAGRMNISIKRAGGATLMAEKAGVSTSVLRKWRAGESDPTRINLIRMAQAANVSLAWLAAGEGDMERDSNPMSGMETQEDYALIPRYDIQVSAGPGTLTQHEAELSRMAFSRDWLQQEGFTATDLVLVSARGDSMEGTIGEGDLLLVDTARRTVKDDGIYVLRVNDGVLAKRLQLDWQGGLWVRSDNTMYEDQHISDEAAASLDVVGRVVWVGRRV